MSGIDSNDIDQLNLDASIINNTQEFEQAAIEYVQKYTNKASDITLKSSIRVMMEMAWHKNVEDRWYFPLIKERVEAHARKILGSDSGDNSDKEDLEDGIIYEDQPDLTEEQLDEIDSLIVEIPDEDE